MGAHISSVFAGALAALALSACSSDDDTPSPGSYQGAGGTSSGGKSSAGGSSAGGSSVGGSSAGGSSGAGGSGAATNPQDGPPAGWSDGHAVVPPEGQPEDVSSPTTVIGTGTPQSCTGDAFVSAVAKGGIITFNC